MSVDIETAWLEENGVTPENLPLLIQEGTLTIDCLPEGDLRKTLTIAQASLYRFAEDIHHAIFQVAITPRKARLKKGDGQVRVPSRHRGKHQAPLLRRRRIGSIGNVRHERCLECGRHDLDPAGSLLGGELLGAGFRYT